MEPDQTGSLSFEAAIQCNADPNYVLALLRNVFVNICLRKSFLVLIIVSNLN